MAKKGKEAKKKPKKQRTGRKHETVKLQNIYEIRDGKLVRKKKPCPRCGQGTWLGQHKNREYCGKCGYTAIDKSKT